MTQDDTIGKILGELSSLSRDVREFSREVKDTHITIASVVTEMKSLTRRVRINEKWQDEKDDKAEATGEQNTEQLRARVRAMTKAAEDAKQAAIVAAEEVEANRRARWFSVLGKAAILVLGSTLALVGPAIASAFGLG